MRHLMSPLDFTVEELDEILDLADDIEANPEKICTRLRRQKACNFILRTEHSNKT